MKIIAIDIVASKCILYALEKKKDGSFKNINGDFKSFTLKDSNEASSVRFFNEAITVFFKQISPDVIAIYLRIGKGPFAGSSDSFKIEGLIQLFEGPDIKIISPKTVMTYYEKNEFKGSIEFKYQERAAQLAHYMLENE